MVQGVVDRHIPGMMPDCRAGPVVGHPTGEGRGDGQAGDVHVVLHAVLWRMGQDHLWLDPTDEGSRTTEQVIVVEDLEVTGDGWMPDRPEGACGCLGFPSTDRGEVGARNRGRTHVAGREISIMNLPTSEELTREASDDSRWHVHPLCDGLSPLAGTLHPLPSDVFEWVG